MQINFDFKNVINNARFIIYIIINRLIFLIKHQNTLKYVQIVPGQNPII